MISTFINILTVCSNYPKDGKADVILRYNPDEARSLKAYGELPENGITLLSLATCMLLRRVKIT